MGQSDKGPTGRKGSGWQNRLPLAQFVRKVLLETIMVSELAFVEAHLSHSNPVASAALLDARRQLPYARAASALT